MNDFWNFPWGLAAIAFLVPMVSKNIYLRGLAAAGETAPLEIVVITAFLDLGLLVCIGLKIAKMAKQRRA